MPVLIRERSLLTPQSGLVRAPAIVTVRRGGPGLVGGVPDTAELVIPNAAFARPGYVIAAELWRATIDNQLVEDVSQYLTDGSVSMDVDRDIKLALSVTVRQPARITPYVDYLAPFVRLTYDDGSPDVYRQLGLYAIKTPPGSYSPTDAVATFAGDDLTRVLADYAYSDNSSSAAGTDYTGQIGGTVTNGGISRHNIPSAPDLLPVAQSWKIGTTRLEKANTLLDQLGWYHLGMDLDGKISTPGAPQDLASMEPYRTIADEDVMSALDVTPAGQDIANVVLVVNDDASAAPLHSVARNDDPSSPTSTVATGREIVRVVSVSGSTTQAALDASAARYLSESRTAYRTAKLTILHDPDALVIHRVVQLTLTGEQADFSGKWWVRQASLSLGPAGGSVLTLSQVTSDEQAVTI